MPGDKRCSLPSFKYSLEFVFGGAKEMAQWVIVFALQA